MKLTPRPAYLMKLLCLGETLKKQNGRYETSIAGFNPTQKEVGFLLDVWAIESLRATRIGGESWIASRSGRSLMNYPILYSIRDLAEITGLSPLTVKLKAEAGDVSGTKLGGMHVFTSGQVEAYLNGRSGELKPEIEVVDTKGLAEALGVNFPVVQRRMMLRQFYGIPLDRRGHSGGGGTAAFTEEMVAHIRPVFKGNGG